MMTVTLMLHNSSGRNNFAFVDPNSKNQPASSQEQKSADQARTIQQQTSEAIKIATESDKATTNPNKNSK
jgi:hypothetical protein